MHLAGATLQDIATRIGLPWALVRGTLLGVPGLRRMMGVLVDPQSARAGGPSPPDRTVSGVRALRRLSLLAGLDEDGRHVAWWVYKCNKRNNSYQRAYGDWEEFFSPHGSDDHWGCVEWTPGLRVLAVGDMVIAYQTDRNELVGIAKVRQSCDVNGYLYLTPVARVGVKVRSLKLLDPRIADIPAFRPGPIKTVYSLSRADAELLLGAAGVRVLPKRP
jgi:hypothetical protein